MTRAPEPVVAMYQNKDDHPHTPPGSPQGGQFQTTNKTPPPAAKKAAPGKAAAKPVAKKPGAKPAPKAPAALPPHAAVTQTLSRKSKNDPAQVRTLQQLLAALKIGNVAEDGVFGPDTEAAVKELQGKLGVRPTGHASPGLAKRLADAAILSPCVKASAGAEIVAAAAGPTAPLGTDMTGVELARPGTWHLSSGKRTFTADNLKDAADFFAASGQIRIPLGFGHADSRFDGDPAFGWVSNIRYTTDAKGPVLLGDLVDMDDWVASAAPTRWPNRSIEGFANLEHDGRTYSLALTRLALLGATPPAMPTLRSLADIRAAINASADAEWFAASALPPSEVDVTDPAPVAVVVPPSKEETGMDPAKFREAMGLEDATDDEVMEALAAAGFVPQPDPSTTSDAIDQSIAASAAATGGVVTIDASQLEEFRASARRADALAKRIEQSDRDTAITAAIQAGKMPPARRPHYERAWDADPQGTRQLINSLAANLVPVAASGYSGDLDGDGQFEAEYADLFPPTGRKAG